MFVWPLYRYILTAAVRDRLLLSLLAVLVVVTSLSLFFGASAVNEQMQFVTSAGASGLRLFGVICLVLFTISYIRRSFDGRDIDYLLSRPINRIGFVLTHSAAFSTLAIIAAGIFSAAILLLQYKSLHAGTFLLCLSLGAEFVVMINVAMFFAFFMKSTTACTIIVASFYLLTRLIGEILGILKVPSDSRLIGLMQNAMEFISIFIPRLDLMGQTKWMLYGMPDNISVGFILAQCGIFVALVVAATLVDMNRRQF